MQLAQDPDADTLLEDDPFALLVGMLLDQQQPMERAFAGPRRICRRLGWERLDPAGLIGMSEEDLVDVMRQPPAVHRYPASMARRVQALAEVVVQQYAGDCTGIWDARDAPTVMGRLLALPGYGPAKSGIFLALLGKQPGVRPQGWREASAPFGEEGSTLSVADVVDAASLEAVRAAKKAMRTRVS
jgi:uncharacterized HhH-GPD family protein